MERGHYRILVGMAAGVGKTYRMLLEGRRAKDEGRDVVEFRETGAGIEDLFLRITKGIVQ